MSFRVATMLEACRAANQAAPGQPTLSELLAAEAPTARPKWYFDSTQSSPWTALPARAGDRHAAPAHSPRPRPAGRATAR